MAFEVMLIKIEEQVEKAKKTSVYADYKALGNNLRALEQILRGKEGKDVLVVKTEESIQGCPGIIPPEHIPPEFYGTDTTLYLGTLSSGLDMSNEFEVVIPVGKYVQKSDNSFGVDGWELVTGDIKIRVFEMLVLVMAKGLKFSPTRDISELERSITIFAGDDVEKYFVEKGRADEYVDCIRVLGNQPPEHLVDGYNSRKAQMKKDLVLTIETLAEEHRKLNERVDKVRKMKGNSDFIEDDADVFFATFGENQRIKRIEGDVRRMLQSAVGFGMHAEQSRFELKPGIEVNVPVYVSDMCKRYGVKIS